MPFAVNVMLKLSIKLTLTPPHLKTPQDYFYAADSPESREEQGTYLDIAPVEGYLNNDSDPADKALSSLFM